MVEHGTDRAPMIAVVGSYGVGMTMRMDAVPGRGETIAGGVFSAGPGGKGSNQAIGAARLGAAVHLLTAIGDDDFGRSAHQLWNHENINATHVVTTSSATMVGVIMVEPDGENRIIIAPGALDELSSPHVGAFADTIADADLMMVSQEIPSAAVERALEVARSVGTRTLLNPAPARDLPASARSNVDYLTPNFGEGQMLAGLPATANATEILDALRATFDATIVLTAGGNGAWVDEKDGGRTHIPPVKPAAIVDTTGAGDAFNAALAVALCRGKTPVQAATYAAAAGAFAVGRAEVIPGLATAAELDAFIAETTTP